MKKILAAALTSAMIFSSVAAPFVSVSAASISSSDYPVAFKDALWFYDANKCGKDVAVDNVFSWRSACHTSDGSFVGQDLTGGFHDCGDHIKFGITNGYAASILGWSMYEFKDAYDGAGLTKKALSTLKYFTDFFMKCRVSATKYYYHVGAPSDHDYWGPPEKQPGDREKVYYVDASHPASDVCGEYSGALSLMYLNYKSVDSTYANKCLEMAKELYALGKNKGTCSADGFYTSSSGDDDMAWAAIWLYIIEKNDSYLNDINSLLSQPYTNWGICWNDMKIAASYVIGEATGQTKYKDAVAQNLTYWVNSIPRSPGGMRILSDWGTLRYSAAAAMLALLQYKQTKDESLKSFAKSQIDYILGANPANMSYMIGFGSKWPQHPHHRAAQGTMGWTDWKLPAKNTLTGALVGGPDASDVYTDQVDKYQASEVGIDYNAGLVAALAGMSKYYSNLPSVQPTNTSQPSPTATNTPVKVTSAFIREDVNKDRAVNMADVVALAVKFNRTTADAQYDANCDVNSDGSINMSDVMAIALKFNYTY
ncbi:MAG: glycoside hydrolase family 9 protein [Bacillota bacterium]|nr:glycoside hydrolase family 9 protein [Bacillota bacterium]